MHFQLRAIGRIALLFGGARVDVQATAEIHRMSDFVVVYRREIGDTYEATTGLTPYDSGTHLWNADTGSVTLQADEYQLWLWVLVHASGITRNRFIAYARGSLQMTQGEVAVTLTIV